MSKYSGEICTVCSKKFDQEDDIVVCPQCGTPYHRSCYQEAGRCINEKLHESHQSWKPQCNDNEEVKDEKICPRCSKQNAHDASECSGCGARLDDANIKPGLNDADFIKIDLSDQYFGMNPDEKMDDEGTVTLGEVGDYVKNNKLYYLSVFKRIRSSGIKISFNIFAFFFPNYYCASRKMYLWSGILTLLSLVFSTPEFIDALAGFGSVTAGFAGDINTKGLFAGILYSCNIITRILFGLFANNIYYRHTINKLKKFRAASKDSAQYRFRVRSEGGTSIVSVIIIMLIEATLVLIAFAAVTAAAYFKAYF
ncbi:MAG: RING finger protein [Oscillospiraceae bacterium]|nr:RING finger protein [Oscillospiraceae bacterium]